MADDSVDSVVSEYLRSAQGWYESQRTSSGRVNTNVMNAGLIVSDMVRDGLPILDGRFYSPRGSQVQGLSGAAIARILARNGENRLFTSEGGRTSRGTLNLADSFRAALNDIQSVASGSALNEVASALEKFFTDRVRVDYFDKQRIDVEIDPGKPVSAVVGDILSAAAERADQPTGEVLQHLVGAKLQLRFPQVEIGMDKANSADQQTDREGDFQVGTTAFHVTVAPMEKIIDRSIRNKRAGYRPVILTPERRVQAARQMVENRDASMASQVSVQAAEIFIGTNIEEIAVYDSAQIRRDLALLVRTYNRRIELIETDKSLQIEEPRWLVRELAGEG